MRRFPDQFVTEYGEIDAAVQLLGRGAPLSAPLGRNSPAS
jgi:hypothetical protein